MIDELTLLRSILNSYPYPVVFVDDGYVIRYMNDFALYHYYTQRGYRDLIGKSLFDCHGEPESRRRIEAAYEKMKKDGKEVYIGVNVRNQRLYMQGVRGPDGRLIGFIERFELNLQK